MAEELEDLHLADLHALAAELGVPRYRLLAARRALVELDERRAARRRPPSRTVAKRRRQSRIVARRRPPSRTVRAPPTRGQERERLDERGPPSRSRACSTSLPQRYGFLRLTGLEPAARRRLHLGLADPPLRASRRRRGQGAGATSRGAASATARSSTSTGSTARSREDDERAEFDAADADHPDAPDPARPRRRPMSSPAPWTCSRRSPSASACWCARRRAPGRTTLLRELGEAVARLDGAAN